MNRIGFDSIGGTIVHELSHNYCGTEDHEGIDGTDRGDDARRPVEQTVEVNWPGAPA